MLSTPVAITTGNPLK